MTEFDKLRVFFNLIGVRNTVALDLNSNRCMTVFSNGNMLFRIFEKVADKSVLNYVNLVSKIELNYVLAKDLVKDLIIKGDKYERLL